MTEKPKRPRGRPRLPDGEGKRSRLFMRARGGIRELLNEAASKNGRSVSEEVEYRISVSFQYEDRLERIERMLEALASKSGELT